MFTRKKTHKQKRPSNKLKSQLFATSRTLYTTHNNINHKVFKLLQGGMNKSKKYNILANIENQYSNISNLSNIESIVNETENAPFMNPPWEPIESQKIQSSSEPKYTFIIKEEYEPTENIWYLYTRIGSDKNPNCVVSIIDSSSEFSIAKIHELHYMPTCSLCSKLPGSGKGARILMNTMMRYLLEKGITIFELSDSAMKPCKNQTEKYYISDLYFLSHGETYYHKFGFLPSNYILEYIKLTLYMKSISWNQFITLSNEKEFKECIRILESCVSDLKLKNTELATTWFGYIWEKDCYTLTKYTAMIYIYIAKYLQIFTKISYIPKIWNTNEQICSDEIHENYNSYMTGAEKYIFYENVKN